MQLEFSNGSGKVIPPDSVDLFNADEFKKGLQSLYDQGCHTIIVDCARLTIIDSTGLGTLILFQKKLQERGGELKIINVNHDYIKRLFEMIELGRLIKIEME